MYDEESNAFWGDGDKEGCTVRCPKCNQYRLTGGDGTFWCRRCRYENYDEYFGPDGENEK